jgi:hypothetical protein
VTYTDGTPPPDTNGTLYGRRRDGASWGWMVAAILAVIVVLLIGWWLWQGGDSPVRETRSVSLGAILEEPESFVDDRIVVSGQVERLLTENAMALSNDFVEAELLVLTPPGAFLDPGGGVAGPGVAAPAGGTGMVAPFLEGQYVQITGAIRTFAAEALTEEYGLVLAPELFEPFEGEAVVVTEFFDIATSGPQFAAPVEEERVDVGAVLSEPEQYAGQAVRLEGGFGEVISDNVFTLTGSSGEGALIVVGEDTGRFDDVEPGRLVHVEGTVHGFNADALREQGVLLDDGVDVSPLEGRPAVIPTAVDVLEAEAEAEVEAEVDAEASPAGDGPAVATPQAS